MTTRFGSRIASRQPTTVSGQGGGGTTCPPTFIIGETEQRGDAPVMRLLLPETARRADQIKIASLQPAETERRADLATITLTGAPLWQSVSAVNSAGASVGSIDVPKPSGVVSGRLLFANVTWDGLATSTIPINTPSGWTLIASSLTAGTSGRSRLNSFWKVAGSSEPANYTFTKDTSSEGTSACCAEVHCIAGQDATTPINVFATASLAATSLVTDPVSPAVVTTVANCLVAAVLCHKHALAGVDTHTAPASNTERTDQDSGGAVPGALTTDFRPFPTAGNTGTATHDCTETVATDAVMHRIAIAGGSFTITV